jgi:hypothetical protein
LTPEARRILVEAKGILSGGWFQILSTSPPSVRSVGDGGHCALTALHAAERMVMETDRVPLSLDVLHGLEGLCGRELVDWNNAPERTHEEVVALFDKALLADGAGIDTGQSAAVDEGHALPVTPRSESPEVPA